MSRISQVPAATAALLSSTAILPTIVAGDSSDERRHQARRSRL